MMGPPHLSVLVRMVGCVLIHAYMKIVRGRIASGCVFAMQFTLDVAECHLQLAFSVGEGVEDAIANPSSAASAKFACC